MQGVLLSACIGLLIGAVTASPSGMLPMYLLTNEVSETESAVQLPTPRSTNTNQCPQLHGWFNHEDSTNCQEYYECVNGVPILRKCHDGLYFDESISSCDWASKGFRTGCKKPSGKYRSIALNKIEDDAVNFNMGEHTLKIPMTLHQENRKRLVKRLQAHVDYAPGSVVLLQGGENTYKPGSGDIHYDFRQESYFHWAFGVLEPGWYGAIDVSSGRAMLFMPRLPQEYVMWLGRIRTPEEYRHQYQVDEVHYVDEMAQKLKEITSGELLILHGINSDSKKVTLQANFDGIGNFTVNKRVLHDEIAECRVFKTEAEMKIMRYAASVACAAHREIMRKTRPGMKEYQLESMFKHHTYTHGGCRHQPYTNVCPSGPSAAILHYGHAGAPNNRTIRDGDSIMLDMGAEYYCYSSDVSISYPANGKFSVDQKKIYNAVLAANQAVAAALRPGVSWVEMQSVAYRAMLEKLKDAGLVQGDIDEMMAANIGSIFLPHGLGHLLGLDVHDVGGYLEGNPYRPSEEGYRYLRTARIIEENMVLTIEPGCYFVDPILDEAFANPKQAQFLVREEIERFRGFGGVRIEDDVLVTANGIENLSHDLPRTVEDIEALMATGREQDVCGQQ